MSVETAALIKVALLQIGFEAEKVRAYPVDARGSEPFIATGNGDKVFIKVVSRRHNLADWAFKLSRRLIRRSLEDETPYVSPKQALEHEAYIETQAIEAGVRSSAVRGLIDLGDSRFGLVKDMIEGKSLDRVNNKRLTQKVVVSIWRQVKIMHSARIAHRDLRAANIILDDHDRAWIIDYDFATIAASNKNMYKDMGELLTSLSTLVGPQKSVKYAAMVLEPLDFRHLKKYVQYRYLSSATRQAVRDNKATLEDLHKYVDLVSTVNR